MTVFMFEFIDQFKRFVTLDVLRGHKSFKTKMNTNSVFYFTQNWPQIVLNRNGHKQRFLFYPKLAFTVCNTSLRHQLHSNFVSSRRLPFGEELSCIVVQRINGLNGV